MNLNIMIIDYGCGNVESIKRGFDKLNLKCQISSNLKELGLATHLILPGVGAFKNAMNILKDKNFVEVITNHYQNNKPLLGICLGMQLLFSKSYEFGETEGLNLIEGSVTKMEVDQNLKLPHVGWNSLIFKKEHELFNKINKNIDYYFVHSYSCNPIDKKHILAEFNYGKNFTSTVAKDNVIGTQFHPEKSLPSGLQLIKNFVNLKD